MTTDFPTAPSAYGLNGPSAAVTVEKSPHASHTEILTPPVFPVLQSWHFWSLFVALLCLVFRRFGLFLFVLIVYCTIQVNRYLAIF